MQVRFLFILLFFCITASAQQNAGKADSTEIRKTILSFYTWYSDNYQKLMGYDLYQGTKTKDQPPYKINWTQVDKYFNFIRTSVPQLGEGYITSLRRHFQQADSAFKQDTESEIPFGFDFDWFTDSQEEPSYLLSELNKAGKWNITVTGDEASVTVPSDTNDPVMQKYPVFCAKMKKYNGSWKIDLVQCPFD